MGKIKIKFKKLHPDAVIPQYATEQSVGMDLCAVLDKPVTLRSLERTIVNTHLSIALPAGFEAQVRPRSGLAAKYGITVLNAPGTIDADYRGDIGVILVNLSPEPFTINNKDRIAQLVISKCERVELVEVEELDKTERGDRGFGSTGI